MYMSPLIKKQSFLQNFVFKSRSIVLPEPNSSSPFIIEFLSLVPYEKSCFVNMWPVPVVNSFYMETRGSNLFLYMVSLGRGKQNGRTLLH